MTSHTGTNTPKFVLNSLGMTALWTYSNRGPGLSNSGRFGSQVQWEMFCSVLILEGVAISGDDDATKNRHRPQEFNAAFMGVGRKGAGRIPTGFYLWSTVWECSVPLEAQLTGLYQDSTESGWKLPDRPLGMSPCTQAKNMGIADWRGADSKRKKNLTKCLRKKTHKVFDFPAPIMTFLTCFLTAGRERPPGLIQHVLTVLVFWSWVLGAPDCSPGLAFCFMGPWTFAWICCPQLPYLPCKNGT